MSKETIANIKGWIPIVILAGSLIAGWVRLDDRVEDNTQDIIVNLASIKALTEYISRDSAAEHEKLDDKIRGNEKDVVEIKANLQSLSKNVTSLESRVTQSMKENRDSVQKILERLPK